MPNKLPPQNLEAEQAVLGSCLLGQEFLDVALDLLPDADFFYKSVHRSIYRVIMDLASRNEPVDVLTVSAELKNKEKLDNIGGPSYLMQLSEHIPTLSNTEHYCRIVKDKSIHRRIISAGSAITDLGYNEEINSDALLDQAEAHLFHAAESTTDNEIKHVSEGMQEVYESICFAHNNKGAVQGYSFGIKYLDKLTSGAKPGNLIIMAGRPGMGKTSYVIDMVRKSAEIGKGAMIFSLEMSRPELIGKLVAMEAQVHNRSMTSGYLKDFEFAKILPAMNHINELPIFIDDSSSITPMTIRARARKAKRKYDISLVVVDYLQLMRNDVKGGTRQEEVADMSRQMKLLAKEINIPVVCLSQLNRACEFRDDKRPLLSDLRESGAVEQDADVVMFLYRDGYYTKNDDDKTTEIIIAKQRNGPQGTAKCVFLPKNTRFEELENYGN